MDDKHFSDCVSILHFYMVNLLDILSLEDVSKRLLERIIESRGEENDLVVNAVLHFYEDCRNVEPGSTRFVKLFVVDLMVTMFGAYGMADDDLVRLLFLVGKMHDKNDGLIRRLKENELLQDLFVLVQYVERPDLQQTESNSSNPPEQEMTWSRRMAALVFDVRGYSEATRRRLQSAALFIIENYPFFTPGQDYERSARRTCEKFMGPKLMAFNMIELEVFLKTRNRNRDIVTRRRMVSLVDAFVNNKLETTNRGRPVYPTGTKLSTDMMDEFLEGLKTGSDEICVFCQEALSTDLYTSSLYCDHFYHLECIQRWLTSNRLCPTCKDLVILPMCEFPKWVWDIDMVESFLNRVY